MLYYFLLLLRLPSLCNLDHRINQSEVLLFYASPRLAFILCGTSPPFIKGRGMQYSHIPKYSSSPHHRSPPLPPSSPSSIFSIFSIFSSLLPSPFPHPPPLRPANLANLLVVTTSTMYLCLLILCRFLSFFMKNNDIVLLRVVLPSVRSICTGIYISLYCSSSSPLPSPSSFLSPHLHSQFLQRSAACWTSIVRCERSFKKGNT